MNMRIFDTLLEPVFILRVNGSISYCNPAASSICDTSERKIIKANNLKEVLSFATPPLWIENLKNIVDPSPYCEIKFEARTSGKTGMAQITVQPFTLENKEEPLWILFFRDVTLEETLHKKYRAEWEQKEKYLQDLEKAHKELENYSKNLEKMVHDRTFQIKQLNSQMSALLDSLDQGFFMFDPEGACLPIASRACRQTLEINPAGRTLWDVLKIPDEKIEGFQKWISTLFSEMLPFQDLADLGPKKFSHTKGLHIHLEYFPQRKPTGELEAVVVVATDTTNLDHARSQAEKEKSFAKMILAVVKKKREITQFIGEARNLLRNLYSEIFIKKCSDLETVFRILHTLKGGAASFSISSLAHECHQSESIIANINREGINDSCLEALKSNYNKVEDEFHRFTSENEAILGTSASQGIRAIELPAQFIESLIIKMKPIATMKNLVEELESRFLSVPIESLLFVFNEVVDQVAAQTGKQVLPLRIHGGDLLVRPENYSELFASLVHSFRNSVDHGIEAPDVRAKSGKSVEGTIAVHCTIIHESVNKDPWLQIRIQDDGKGINPEAIRSKLKDKGVSIDSESDVEVIQHVFDSQFSTADKVSETSGRGVGMDAILAAAKNLGGKAWVESRLGFGTSLYIQVPYLKTVTSSAEISKNVA